MGFAKKINSMPIERKQQVQKVIDTLKIGGRSENTIKNYVSAINRFLNYFENEDISNFSEDNIIDYIILKIYLML